MYDICVLPRDGTPHIRSTLSSVPSHGLIAPTHGGLIAASSPFSPTALLARRTTPTHGGLAAHSCPRGSLSLPAYSAQDATLTRDPRLRLHPWIRIPPSSVDEPPDVGTIVTPRIAAAGDKIAWRGLPEGAARPALSRRHPPWSGTGSVSWSCLARFLPAAPSVRWDVTLIPAPGELFPGFPFCAARVGDGAISASAMRRLSVASFFASSASFR